MNTIFHVCILSDRIVHARQGGGRQAAFRFRFGFRVRRVRWCGMSVDILMCVFVGRWKGGALCVSLFRQVVSDARAYIILRAILMRIFFARQTLRDLA